MACKRMNTENHQFFETKPKDSLFVQINYSNRIPAEDRRCDEADAASRRLLFDGFEFIIVDFDGVRCNDFCEFVDAMNDEEEADDDEDVDDKGNGIQTESPEPIEIMG